MKQSGGRTRRGWKKRGRFYVVTLGCPKNQVDSEGLSAQLVRYGYRPVARPKEADFIIVNTCGFLETARQEAIDTLRTLAARRRAGQHVIAAGCLAQLWGAQLAHVVPGLDGIIGTRSWADIPQVLAQLATRRETPVVHVPEVGHTLPDADVLRLDGQQPRASAYLKIAEGCSAGCAFCLIPTIKGPARSRPRAAILREAQMLVEQGVRELILIAQDTTAYGHDLGEREGLATLIEDILRVAPELRWLRLMYAYPGRVSERLIEVMATHPQVCHYLDLPVQHGHPATLRRMRRPHDVTGLIRWIERLRQAMPDIALRTSLIVGYPGETEEEFQALLDFMQTVRFDRVGIFPYSREPGTPAYALPGQLPEEVKRARYERAMQLQQSISWERNQAQVGRQLEVLVEGANDGISVARSYRDAPEVDGFVLVQGEHPVNSWLSVRIIAATPYDLIAVSETSERGSAMCARSAAG
ncbi:MAG: 30S ribosomal protein S12 methylthiotransferase RimO [Anaerolineae bacterium]|nr:30S ribosomal protein S12 methylthiotransferase RimO [Anaerolineae bacterium]MDW8071585.1 30S ribosomal protein S12 methylthiotransferase RimO [Anaerolineae bacterium]